MGQSTIEPLRVSYSIPLPKEPFQVSLWIPHPLGLGNALRLFWSFNFDRNCVK